MKLRICLFFSLLIIGFLSSCNNDGKLKSKADKDIAKIYPEAKFDAQLMMRAFKKSDKIADSVLRKQNISPIDRVSAYILKIAFNEESDPITLNGYYAKADSIIKDNNISLKNYPSYYVVYMLGKNEFYLNDGNFNASKALLLDLETYVKDNPTILRYRLYDKTAKYYYLHKELLKTLAYSKKSFDAMPNKNPSDSIIYNYKRIITLNREQRHNKKYIDTMQAIFNASQKILKHSKIVPASQGYLARAEAMIAFAKGDYAKSSAITEKQFLQAKSQGEEMAFEANNLSSAYINAGNFEKAKNYSFKALKLAVKENNNLDLLSSYENLAEIARNTGNKSDELIYLGKAYLLSKDVYNKQKEEAITKLEKDYTVKLKTKENELLAKENLQKEKTLKTRTIIFSILALFSLLTVLFIYFLLRQRILKKQLEKTKVEQQLFRLQMNPHFLFNSIAGIRGNILNDEKMEAVDYLSKFSKLLRQQLENNNKEWIGITDEIEFIENYISVQQLRYKDKFDYKINVSEDLDVEDLMIPSMILQPFIENSIEHGFFNIKHKGLITIDITPDTQNTIAISIKDNGCGFNQKKNMHITANKNKSMAMDIVKIRLAILSRETKTNCKFEVIEADGVIVNLILGVR